MVGKPVKASKGGDSRPSVRRVTSNISRPSRKPYRYRVINIMEGLDGDIWIGPKKIDIMRGLDV